MRSWAKATHGTGTIFKRGRIWYLSYCVDGQQVVRSSRSANIQAAKRLRDQILGKKSRGELEDAVSVNVTCGELLDDLLHHAKANIKASTEKIWRFVVKASIGPFFGHRKTDYRRPQGVPSPAFGGRHERVDMQSRTFNASHRV